MGWEDLRCGAAQVRMEDGRPAEVWSAGLATPETVIEWVAELGWRVSLGKPTASVAPRGWVADVIECYPQGAPAPCSPRRRR